MEVVEVEEVEVALVVEIRYLQELNVPLLSSKEVEVGVLTVLMNKNVPSSAALSMSSSALR